MNTSYSSLLNDLQKSLDNCTSSNELYKIKSTFLGKKGILANQFNQMINIPHDEKKKIGQELNKIKTKIELVIREKEKSLTAQKLETKNVKTHLLKNSDHRMSSDEDIDFLKNIIDDTIKTL